MDKMNSHRYMLHEYFVNTTNEEEEGCPVGPPTELHLRKENKCFLISNRFENSKQHPLTQYNIDEENITKTFSWLNFRVEKKTNLSTGKIKSFIDGISKDDYTDSECIVLFILSHGNNKGEIHDDENNILDVDWVINKLDVESLRGKPKLIFVQLCGGGENMKKVDGGDNNAIQITCKSNTSVFRCTCPGNRLEGNGGSIFTNTLCMVLREYCKDSRYYHLGDVVTKVNDILSKNIQEDLPSGNDNLLGEVSEAYSSLISPLYFYPRKDYHDFVADYVCKEKSR